ncbi:MAG: rhodanese-like domain-containing protein [Calditrichaeota bacterium]|nr:rhodanese-like domain-containing protein [Calditrichota bacterium]
MSKNLSHHYKTELRLAALFILLGFLAIFMGDPYKKPELKVSFTDVEQILKQPVQQIEAIELAKFIMHPNEAYRLIDLRPEAEFKTYRIPGAERADLNNLKDMGIFVNERIILYTHDEDLAVQAYFILVMQSYFKVSVLKGGINQWKTDVLFPDISNQNSDFESRKTISTFFGGQIRDQKSSGTDSLKLPDPIYIQKPAFDPESCG